ncbi:MAG TPA: SUMF1/EgtB/PvdO family nonheme iron enzyme [Fibrobacteria bacterium]|nr:SUMF1/EgtB/PvdO family nonheme iron enzyme [Fibrobacteria bacterium]
MDPSQEPGNEARHPSGPEAEGARAAGPERRRWLPYLVFVLTLLLALVFHRCQEETLPPASTLPKPPAESGPPRPMVPVAPPETIPAPRPEPADPEPVKPPRPKDTAAAPRALAPIDSGPYLWADPWGGRHFDSVRVTLHCREGCLLLYSLEDSIHFKSYEDPLVFKRNATLWISGIDSLNRQAEPVRVEYVIERNPGACAGNSMPLSSPKTPGGKAVCMDLYEWPDSDGAVPRAFVNQKEAADSCKSAGKRLCTEAEWREACQGPDKEAYPYGGRYNENRCPAKEAASSRSGRFPACRSYYGLYDMTGNLWEWTATPAPDPDFFMVAGGNWTAGNEATCGYAKFSFYPTVRYPFVGFRCCQDVAGGR